MHPRQGTEVSYGAVRWRRRVAETDWGSEVYFEGFLLGSIIMAITVIIILVVASEGDAASDNDV